VSRYEKGPLGPTVTIGGIAPGEPVVAPEPSPEQVEKQKRQQDLVDGTPDSSSDEPVEVDNIYPHWVWIGTPYQEFADFCGKANLYPKRLFIESARTYLARSAGTVFLHRKGDSIHFF